MSDLDTVLPLEAKKIIGEAAKQVVTLRLIGALAVRLHSKTSNEPGFARKLSDLDFVGYSKQGKKIKEFFVSQKYNPNERFNFVHGARRQIYYHPEYNFQVDVFLDIFEMCHTLDLRGRLELDPSTIPLADLVATKLQIVELNEKDVKDLSAIIKDHDIAYDDNDFERINVKYLAELCSKDWGIYKTLTMNLAKIDSMIGDYVQPQDLETIRNRMRQINQTIENQPKTLKWKMRAKIGESRPWYQLPDTRSAQGGT